jgi:hypothetical protein
MAIKVQWEADGPFAICDSAAEAVELLKQARSINRAIPKNAAPLEVPMPQAPRANPTRTDNLSEFFGSINERSKKLLAELAKHPEGVDGDAFAKVCNTDGPGLGGILGGISKHAKKAHMTIGHWVQSEMRVEGIHRFRWITPTKLLLEQKDRIL